MTEEFTIMLLIKSVDSVITDITLSDFLIERVKDLRNLISVAVLGNVSRCDLGPSLSFNQLE